MKIGVIALLISGSAFASVDPTVIAKYGNFYRGDDDLYGQCLVVSDSKTAVREIIFQGLSGVTIKTTPISSENLQKLEGMRGKLDADSKVTTYSTGATSYDFLNVDQSAGPDFVVLGQAPGNAANLTYDQYFSVSAASEVAQVLKSICQMEE